jgi:hypothetical protein
MQRRLSISLMVFARRDCRSEGVDGNWGDTHNVAAMLNCPLWRKVKMSLSAIAHDNQPRSDRLVRVARADRGG